MPSSTQNTFAKLSKHELCLTLKLVHVTVQVMKISTKERITLMGDEAQLDQQEGDREGEHQGPARHRAHQRFQQRHPREDVEQQEDAEKHAQQGEQLEARRQRAALAEGVHQS